ncbi:nuclear transport factor 2 family protein [Actinomadura flavalba]|uniref:nuclear transport factor 2 family protein n=1 Tax=Actinomadura flavalba TaxID=1120938 RepID=UPI001F0A521A|nr:nuclear transport factor 2 family protein [Actinomadura flavalba]
MTTADTAVQQAPAELARRYYARVDAQDLDGLLALFHDAVRYERQGTPAIEGLDALRTFYESERIIAEGRHRLDQVLGGEDGWIAVRGRFEGRLHSGEQVALRFTDWLHFTDGLIDHRETLFPGRQV